MLKVENITKKIDGRDILKNISLTLSKKEIVSVIGPSGAGKTSLLRALAFLDFPDEGSIHIDDQQYQYPIQNPEKFVYPYPKLTVVFQQLFIWPHLTIRENLTLPLKGNIDHDHFNHITTLFQMKGFLDRYPNHVSIGQRQRAALVRALLLRPQYLLLDEVTSALDIEQSHIILSHLREIAESGVGIFFVSHAIHLAHKISDRIIFLEDGKIIEEGRKEILITPQSERLKKFLSYENSPLKESVS